MSIRRLEDEGREDDRKEGSQATSLASVQPQGTVGGGPLLLLL